MSENHRHSVKIALVALTCTALSACSSVRDMTSGVSASAINPINWVTPYKVDVIQGNFVSSEQVGLLRAGMTREQVKAIMGTPLLSSLFHADRWDYVFTLNRQGVEPQSYKYTVFFKGDQLDRFSGDTMPNETEFITRLVSKRTLGEVPVLEATEDQLNKATGKPSAPQPAAAAAASAAAGAAAPATAYPPLESPRQ